MMPGPTPNVDDSGGDPPSGGPSENAADDSDDGVRIDMISGARMKGLTGMEKIRLILDGVRDGNIVILEEGLSPDEESKLIEVTMTEISPDDFTGIEIETYPKAETNDQSFLDKLIGRESTQKLTVIGPANRIETLHKDENLISTLVSRR